MKQLTTYLALLLALSACEPVSGSFDSAREEAPIFQRSSLVAPPAFADPAKPALKVMAWNLKFGAGRIDFWFDFWGDRVQMTADEVSANMAGLYGLINEIDPDLLLASEVDVNSRRSAYFDMVQGILENTKLNYAAYFQTWNSRYIPSEGLGRMDMGNAIFSKHPITFAERIQQADRTDLGSIEKRFHVHRAIGHATLIAGSRTLQAYVVHADAYDTDGTKQRQLQQIHDLMTTEQAAGSAFIVGGDFNELPPTAVKRSDFPDEHPSSKGTSLAQPPYTPEVMQKFFDGFSPAIPLATIGTTEAAQKRYFTHSIQGFWNRTLDYLFIRKTDAWGAGSTDVLQSPGDHGIISDPMQLSDHAPVIGTWQVQP